MQTRGSAGNRAARGLARMALVATVLWTGLAMAQSPDAFMGTYEGVYRSTGRPDATATGVVVTEGPGLYRAALRCQTEGPDPDAWQVEVHGQLQATRVVLGGFAQGNLWNGDIKDAKLTLAHADSYGGTFELSRVEKHSPTEGQAPPAGAVVLLPYAEGVTPDMAAWDNPKWEAMPDGSMQVTPQTGQNVTKAAFGDMQLHLEFRVPYMPFEFGQGRGNSGLYLQSRYEVQILDSFGVMPAAGDCGALYLASAPRVNACYPPEQWQTYDILFRAPRLNGDGAMREPARVTIRHNGVLIQDNVALSGPTPGGIEGKPAERDKLFLQDHGNRMRYRNIWLVELKEGENPAPPAR